MAESRAEIAYAAEFFRWFSEEAVRIHGRYMVNTTGKGRILTMRQPVGPCVFVTPWNFPTAMGTRKIAPAIAAGCTMVVKPAQQTPLSMLALAQILEESGLPGGVLNVITAQALGRGDRTAAEGPAHAQAVVHRLDRGRRALIEQSADQILRMSMELGGNAPFLVFEDADLDAAVEGAMLAKMRNVGEACTAANRFHVHESLAEEFATAAGRAHGRAEGRPRHRAGRRRRPADRRHPARQGAGAGRATRSTAARRCSSAGSPGDGPGYFYEPTVLAAVPDDARLLSRGDLRPGRPGRDVHHRRAGARRRQPHRVRARRLRLHARPRARASASCEGLETGMVGLNQGVVSNPAAPFGGVKQSGFGREGGFEGIDEYLETKYVAIAV